MSDIIVYPTIETFDNEVLKSSMPVLVDFYADWCGPCQALAPVLETIADKYQDRVKVCKINVDQAQQLAIAHKVMSIPTMLFVKNGEVEDRVVGGLSEQELSEKLDAML